MPPTPAPLVPHDEVVRSDARVNPLAGQLPRSTAPAGAFRATIRPMERGTEGAAGAPETPRTRGAFVVDRHGTHRRPSGEAPPLPKASWWPRIVTVLVVILLLGCISVVVFRTSAPSGTLAWFSRFQTDPVTDV